MAKTWYAIDVTVRSGDVAAVENAFDILDALGTETSTLGQREPDRVTTTAFFDEEPDLGLVGNVLADSFEAFEIEPDDAMVVRSREVVEEDWLAEWKRHWRPTDVGRFVIAPPWSDVAQDDKILIRIEPNMAFGTGTHDTTRLCLEAIGEHYKQGESVLDVGTGTGILAIAAAKLGATKIFACDTDEPSIRIARENAVANGVGEVIKFATGSIDKNTPEYDFTFANLTIDVILPLLPLLIAKTQNTLLLSGILAEQEKLIVDELLRSQISIDRISRSGEWIAVNCKLSTSNYDRKRRS